MGNSRDASMRSDAMRQRILFVDNDEGRSGSTVSLEYLVKAFHEQGYEVYVLTRKDDKTRRCIIDSGGIPVAYSGRWSKGVLAVHFTSRVTPLFVRIVPWLIVNAVRFVHGMSETWRAISRLKPQLVYVNEYVLVQCSIAAYVRGVPSVIHIRSQFLQGVVGLRWILSRLILTFNDFVFAITDREAEQIDAREEEKSKIKVVHEFVTEIDRDASLRDKLCRKLGLPCSKKIITCLGGIMSIKGTLDFLQAAKSICSERGDVVFVIAGRNSQNYNATEKSYYERCAEIMKELIDSGAGRDLGEVSDPLDLLRVSYVLVSPSVTSHFSRPVVEAWMAGVPIIAARTAHMLDLVTDGVDGLLISIGDSQALAQSILLLLSSKKIYRRLALEGRRKALAEYSAKTNTTEIVNYCSSLVRQQA